MGQRPPDREPPPTHHPPFTKLLAWFVHLYTALGLFAAAAIAVLIVRGEAASFRSAFLLMVIATLIDATDGTLARAVQVKTVLPGFDGRRLDDLIDFLNYTFLPLFLIWRAALLPSGYETWLLLPLLASAYGFCQVDAKTADGFFLGFPSYWNIVAVYLYALPFPPGAALGIIVALSLLTFVPLRYLYPSLGGRLNRWTNWLGAAWTVVMTAVIWRLPHDARPEDVDPLAAASLIFPAYYLATSWWLNRPRRHETTKDMKNTK